DGHCSTPRRVPLTCASLAVEPAEDSRGIGRRYDSSVRSLLLPAAALQRPVRQWIIQEPSRLHSTEHGRLHWKGRSSSQAGVLLAAAEQRLPRLIFDI
ncbi:hypothetical protein PFISCL1PPCAC_3551, partial [Pristionchus fissidentatus]